LEPSYTQYERVYDSMPSGATGWNSLEVDAEILRYVDELIDQSGISAPSKLLEIGCGMGNLSIPLARRGFHVTGVDISPTAIKFARCRGRAELVPPRFLVGDVLNSDSYNGLGSFNAVLDGLCLHCIIGADRSSLLRLVSKVLVPGGKFLVITMVGDPRSAKLRRKFDEETRCITDGRVQDRYLGRPCQILDELINGEFAVRFSRTVEGNSDSGDQDLLLAIAEKRQ